MGPMARIASSTENLSEVAIRISNHRATISCDSIEAISSLRLQQKKVATQSANCKPLQYCYTFRHMRPIGECRIQSFEKCNRPFDGEPFLYWCGLVPIVNLGYSSDRGNKQGQAILMTEARPWSQISDWSYLISIKQHCPPIFYIIFVPCEEQTVLPRRRLLLLAHPARTRKRSIWTAHKMKKIRLCEIIV